MSPATHAPIGRPHPRMLTRANTDGEDTIFHQTVARKRKHPHVMAKVESKPRSDLPARRALSSQSVRPSVVYIASMAEVRRRKGRARAATVVLAAESPCGRLVAEERYERMYYTCQWWGILH